jgi:hypothetical protein
VIAGVLPSPLPVWWLSLERDARHLIISGREEGTGRTLRIEFSRQAGLMVGMTLCSLARTKPADSDVLDFGTNLKIEVA